MTISKRHVGLPGIGLLGIAGLLELGADRVAGLGLEHLEVGPAQPFAAAIGTRFGADDDIGAAVGRGTRREADALGDERALGDVAGADELGGADRVELHRAGCRIGVDEDRRDCAALRPGAGWRRATIQCEAGKYSTSASSMPPTITGLRPMRSLSQPK